MLGPPPRGVHRVAPRSGLRPVGEQGPDKAKGDGEGAEGTKASKGPEANLATVADVDARADAQRSKIVKKWRKENDAKEIDKRKTLRDEFTDKRPEPAQGPPPANLKELAAPYKRMAARAWEENEPWWIKAIATAVRNTLQATQVYKDNGGLGSPHIPMEHDDAEVGTNAWPVPSWWGRVPAWWDRAPPWWREQTKIWAGRHQISGQLEADMFNAVN